MALTNQTWSFIPLVTAFPETLFPNVAFWNITNGLDLQYHRGPTPSMGGLYDG